MYVIASAGNIVYVIILGCLLLLYIESLPIWDFKLVHMCWEQLPVVEWADCVLIVYLAIADDPSMQKWAYVEWSCVLNCFMLHLY